MTRLLNDLQALVRTGPGFECSECLAPILTNHVYFIDASDVHGSHPYCWLCGVSIKIHLGQLSEADLPTVRQFGPL